MAAMTNPQREVKVSCLSVMRTVLSVALPATLCPDGNL